MVTDMSFLSRIVIVASRICVELFSSMVTERYFFTLAYNERFSSISETGLSPINFISLLFVCRSDSALKPKALVNTALHHAAELVTVRSSCSILLSNEISFAAPVAVAAMNEDPGFNVIKGSSPERVMFITVSFPYLVFNVILPVAASVSLLPSTVIAMALARNELSFVDAF